MRCKAASIEPLSAEEPGFGRRVLRVLQVPRLIRPSPLQPPVFW